MLIERFDKNPVLKPNKNQSWEAQAVFNGCPIKINKEIYILYRAISLDHYYAPAGERLSVSSIGITQSKDGINFYNRRCFITPEYSWEKFGCEDPRVTKMNNKYYIFYTAISVNPPNADGIKIGLAISKDLKTVQEKHLITPFNAKAMAFFPEKIGKKMWAALTVHTDKPPAKICLASFEKESDLWSENYWEKWRKDFEKYALNLQRRPQDHIEVGAGPIKTKKGWLLIYSYIRDYFSPKPIFSFEAVLLDLKNPLKVIAHTDAPILTPEEYYEKIGLVPNVIFPSGAFLRDNLIYLYYGACDIICCLCFIDSKMLLEKLLKIEPSTKLSRAKENPIISPIAKHSWEAKSTFNPAAIYIQGKFHIIYRAMSEDNVSVLGYAASKDGIHIDCRSPEPIYVPRESFEQKLSPGGNSGCEDPRITKINNKIYMFYTAVTGKYSPRIALSWIEENDFLNQKWNWSKPILISSPNIDDKNACLFPEKIKEKYMIIHRIGDDIDLAFCPDLNFDGKTWLSEYRWIIPRKGMWDSKKVGAAAPPIKTKKGWVLFYHGVSEEDNFYRVGACLLSLNDPTKVIARSDKPIFEPERVYEKIGDVPNVVFPCGAVLIKGKFFLYYGGADKVIGVSFIKEKDLLDSLMFCRC